jgi:hypothetical protein
VTVTIAVGGHLIPRDAGTHGMLAPLETSKNLPSTVAHEK